MARRHQNQVTIVGVAGRDGVGAMRRFVDRYGLGFFPHVADTDGSLWTKLGVAGQPAWIFIDRSGTARTVYGALTDPALERELDRIAA